MTIKYEAKFDYKPILIARDVIRETPTMIIFKTGVDGTDHRSSKSTNHSQVFDTWEAAHEWLVGKARARVESQRENLKFYEQKLAIVEALEPGANIYRDA